MDDKEILDRLQFLYSSRLSVLNDRHQYEWKNFFGEIGLILALDAAVLQFRIHLTGWMFYGWILLISGLFTASIFYHWQLQLRNYLDRRAMNEINNRICQALNLPEESQIFEGDKKTRSLPKRRLRLRQLWAFFSQMGLLLLVALGSIGLAIWPPDSIKSTAAPMAPCYCSCAVASSSGKDTSPIRHLNATETVKINTPTYRSVVK